MIRARVNAHLSALGCIPTDFGVFLEEFFREMSRNKT